MDVSREHYAISKLTLLNRPQFWDGKISWLNKYKNRRESDGLSTFYELPFMDTFSDAWHLFKSLMVIFLMAAIVFSNIEVIQPVISFNLTITLVIRLILLGAIWIGTFNLFFNHILIIQKEA